MTQEISPELVDRMMACIRAGVAWADNRSAKVSNATDTENLDEARAIVALLPEPVDPDRIEGRNVAATAHMDMHGYESTAEAIRAGRHDDWILVIGCVAAIKRGRELAKQGQSS